MSEENKIIVKDKSTWGSIYGLGLIGSAVYFVQQTQTFWGDVLGILKAIVWPAFLIYRLFEFLAK